MKPNARTKGGVSRRQFLGWTWAVSGAWLIGQAGVALYRFFLPQVEAGGFGDQIVAGNVDEFQPGTVSHVQKGRFYISRLEDGGILAIWHRCTHLGCTVPWREDEGQFHCPCHSSLFNRQGEVTGGPAPRPLDLFPVTVQGGKLVVDTSQPLTRQNFDASQEFHPD